MKIALYIEDGLEQIVLTPQTETEKGILGKLSDGDRSLNIYRGQFYASPEGWTRRDTGERSTIIVLRPQSKVQA
jgi:hypothetical protein